ncbi:MAG: hypothetical protein KY456_05560 [Chloroflexi bacterium]|nr:hypothetical protein [Chloroflexota bacterium]
MARQNEFDRHRAGWRDLALAGVAAAAVTLVLVAAVALVWLTGRSPSESPVLAVQGPSKPTPTPRALAFIQVTPTTPAEAPTVIAVVATPDLVATSTESETAPANEDGEATRFEVPGDAEYQTLASGSWTASETALVNAGSSAVAEPWLALTSVSNPAFAVEAEIRVNGLLDSVCDQSFGLVGGSPDAGAMFGGGLLFPCEGDGARARLTDVAVWEDGYNADPVLAEEPFNPGEDWHTYRFEVRGDQLRFIIDGAGVVSGAPEAVADFTSIGAEAGLWAQGVDLEVRKVSVEPLPSG